MRFFSVVQLVSQSLLPATGQQGVGWEVGNEKAGAEERDPPLVWSQPVTTQPPDLSCHQEGIFSGLQSRRIFESFNALKLIAAALYAPS